MTDERAPGEPQAPDPGTPPEPPNQQPPPLAPLLDQGGSPPADPSSETTVQPTSTWEGPTHVPPPIAPPQPQPAVSWAPPPAAGSVAGKRTALSAAAGILLIIGGILGALAGLAIAVIGRAFIQSIENFGPMPELEGMDVETFLSGFVVFLGIIIAVYSVVYLIAGIGVLRSRDWGRVLGIVVGILSGLVWLSGLSSGNRSGTDSIVGTLIALGIHVYIVVALLFFWRTKPSTA
jgi:hypothetical protein